MKKFKKLTTSFVASLTLLAVVPVAAQAEWKESSNGWWYSQGSSYSTSWKNIDGQWYYFGSDGYMKTGWIKDNGNWYYLNGDGTMARNTTIEGYYINSSGTISSDQTATSSSTWSCH
ncbi:hypothetical protein D2A34_26290 [Clostridium chromiireducens]|uniref:N-acetylmuramoyl-L-alanine amidase n=1 Tax=Clostridium chromiireducens TaxID=225345 RepID=A0A399IHM6_9CLOT|nr:hypothetical protein [Clostridium chromiireducens]RII31877.1 hypothetical protein D2A34_26290 [Clostridium chromiireducens]